LVNKRVCIVGKGSIGVRHAKIFNKLNCKIFFLRSRKNLTNYKLNFPTIEIDKFKKIKKNYFDLIIICNPTSLHLTTLKKLSNFSKTFLIEKPITSKFDDYKGLKKFMAKKKNKLFTGFYLRYDKRIIRLKKIYDKNFKKAKYSKIVWKTYAPSWHKGENFKYSYAGLKKLGGGVINTCSHEIDLAIYLFGKVKEVFCKKIKSNLNTDVENAVLIFLKHQNNLVSEINLNFGCRKEKTRYSKIFFNDFTIEYNFEKKNLVKTQNYSKKILKVRNFKNNHQAYTIQDEVVLKNSNKYMSVKEKKSILHSEKIIQLAKLSLEKKVKIISSKYP